MTYCLAIRVNSGIVFAADTRTNAGVDYVTAYRKLFVFQPNADRVLVLLSAGSLATTQAILQRVRGDLADPDARESFASVSNLFQAADYVGRVSRQVQERHAEALRRSGISGEASLILGGQVRGQPDQIFLIYPQGNFIETSEDTPYLQIGENKYGKPMLDRIVSPELSLENAARLALVSLDATIRSNISVGAPFDVALYSADTLAPPRELRVELDSPYYAALRSAWQQGIAKAFADLPLFEWESAPPA